MISFSKKGVQRTKNLISTTTNGIMEYLAFVSIDEKQVTELYCFNGTSE